MHLTSSSETSGRVSFSASRALARNQASRPSLPERSPSGSVPLLAVRASKIRTASDTVSPMFPSTAEARSRTSASIRVCNSAFAAILISTFIGIIMQMNDKCRGLVGWIADHIVHGRLRLDEIRTKCSHLSTGRPVAEPPKACADMPIMGGKRCNIHRGSFANPLARIGPVGRPVGDPPACSSVIS